jgi:hypothetical protein
MATVVKPTSSTYVFYNCHKCGMSLTGPDTKLRFHRRDTERRWGCVASVINVIFPSPYTGVFSSYDGLKILANGKEKYNYVYQYHKERDFYIKFQTDGSFQVECYSEHVCVPFPKLTREEIFALWQNGKRPYFSDISPEDQEWVLDPPASDIAKLKESISSKKRLSTSSDTNEPTNKTYISEVLKDIR